MQQCCSTSISCFACWKHFMTILWRSASLNPLPLSNICTVPDTIHRTWQSVWGGNIWPSLFSAKFSMCVIPATNLWAKTRNICMAFRSIFSSLIIFPWLQLIRKIWLCQTQVYWLFLKYSTSFFYFLATAHTFVSQALNLSLVYLLCKLSFIANVQSIFLQKLILQQLKT